MMTDWALEHQGPRTKVKCDHTTCPGCDGCACHKKPKVPKLVDVDIAKPVPEPLEHIRQLLPAFLPSEVNRRVKQLVKAGHRSASFSEGRSSGETPDLVAVKMLKRQEPWRPHSGDDDQPTPPDPISGLADPTDREILALEREYKGKLRAARDAVMAALVAQDKILAVSTLEAKRVETPPDDCLSCKRHTLDNGQAHYSVRADPKRRGKDCVLCVWCDDWDKANGSWPPVEIVALHARGKTINSKALLDAGLIEPSDIVVGAKNRVVTLVIPHSSEAS